MIIRRFTKSEQNFFVICLFFVFMYSGYRGLILPLKGQIVSVDRKIEAEHKKLDKSSKIIQKAKALEGEYNEFLSKFKQDKSNEQVMSSILTEIEGVAGELDLHISDLKPKIVNKYDNYNRFSVSLTIDSEFVTTLKFIHILQQEPHYFGVDELRFDNNTQRNVSSIKSNLVFSKVLIP